MAAAERSADEPLPDGSAVAITRDCEVCFACICPAGYFVIWQPPRWKSTSDLIAFHVQEGWHDDVTTLESGPAGALPPFVAEYLQHGGPWNGRFVADAVHVTFMPGTSPADAAAFAKRYGLKVTYSDEPMLNQSSFNPAADISPAQAVNEVRRDPLVCAASLFRFDGAYELVPIVTPGNCNEPLALGVDSGARVTAGGVTVRTDPSAGAAPLRPKLPANGLAYIIAGPTRVDDVDWWQVAPLHDYDRNVAYPMGWVPATRPDGTATLTPSSPRNCPPLGEQLTARVILNVREQGPADELACFGSRELAFETVITCTGATVDPLVGGADWIAQDCRADDVLSVAISSAVPRDRLGPGFGTEQVGGTFAVRGHYHDPQADNCFYVPFGAIITTPSAPPDTDAVFECRQQLVITQMDPL